MEGGGERSRTWKAEIIVCDSRKSTQKLAFRAARGLEGGNLLIV